MRVGVVANEFFDPERGRIGGFGWAARRVAQVFAERPELGVDVTLFSGERTGEGALDGAPLLAPTGNRVRYARRARRARIDLVLAIDYRPAYLPLLLALPRTPLVVWVRDPHSRAERARLATLRVPGANGYRRPAPHDLGSLRPVTAAGRLLRRPILWAAPAPATLGPRAVDAYPAPVPSLRLLPNPVPPGPTRSEAARPRVVFVGRLDPVKRPWLFVELARRLPDAEFLLLGGRYAEGWEPRDVPANVRLLGHVDGAEKQRLVASAWALVNTSIHEGLPVSFVEALAAGTPLVASQDPEGVVTRFGVRVAECGGDGLDSLDAYEAALRRLLADRDERTRLGEAGRAWAASTHTPERFVDAFLGLCADAGVRR